MAWVKPGTDPGGRYTALPTEELNAAGLHMRSQPSDGGEVDEPCVEALLASPSFQVMIALLILVNAAVIGMETDMPNAFNWNVVENGLLAVFAAELAMKVYVSGMCKFLDIYGEDISWNAFDLAIVAMGILDCALEMISGHSGNTSATLFRIIRLLRIMRVFRIVRYLKQLYLLAFGFAEAAQAILWVTILMTFILYVCSVVMARTIGRPEKGDPNYDFLVEHFGGVLRSMLTLFELMSTPNLPEYQEQGDMLWRRPVLMLFLVGFIIFGSFGMTALLTGVISESMFEKNELRMEEARMEREQRRKKLVDHCTDIFQALALDEDNEADREDVEAALPRLSEVLREQNVEFAQHDLEHMIKLMDTDLNGTISQTEFTHAVLFQAEGVRPMSMQEMHYDVSCCKHKLDKLIAAMDQMIDVHNVDTAAALTMQCLTSSGGSKQPAGGSRQESKGKDVTPRPSPRERRQRRGATVGLPGLPAFAAQLVGTPPSEESALVARLDKIQQDLAKLIQEQAETSERMRLQHEAGSREAQDLWRDTARAVGHIATKLDTLKESANLNAAAESSQSRHRLHIEVPNATGDGRLQAEEVHLAVRAEAAWGPAAMYKARAGDLLAANAASSRPLSPLSPVSPVSEPTPSSSAASGAGRGPRWQGRRQRGGVEPRGGVVGIAARDVPTWHAATMGPASPLLAKDPGGSMPSVPRHPPPPRDQAAAQWAGTPLLQTDAPLLPAPGGQNHGAPEPEGEVSCRQDDPSSSDGKRANQAANNTLLNLLDTNRKECG